MNGEGGSVASTGPSIGPAIGSTSGPSFEGSVGRFGSTFINEGPVGPSFLENTMPISFNVGKPAIEVISNPFKAGEVASEVATPHLQAPTFEPLTVEGAIAEAQLIVSEAARANQPSVESFQYVRGREYIDFLWLEPVPKIYPDIQQIRTTKKALENAGLVQLSRRIAQSTQTEIATTPLTEEQIVEEEVLVEERTDQSIETEEEEVEEIKLKYLLDEEVAKERVDEIGRAIELAGEEVEKDGKKGIEGWRIIRFLRLHSGLISQIVKHRGSDGSLNETVQNLASRRFASVQEAKEQSKAIVSEKEPVKRGKEGKTVQEGAVERVLKHYFIKGVPKEEVVLRVVKKQKVQLVGGQPVPIMAEPIPQVREPSIEDDPDLADVVFPKAA